MLYYSEKDVFKILLKKEKEGYEGATEYLEDVKEAYRQGVLLEPEKFEDKKIQENLIDQAITQIVKRNQSLEDFISFRHEAKSGIKHMEFFENFLGKEERRNLQKALIENNINFNVLAGIRAIEYGTQSFNFGDVSVEVEWETIDGSPVIVSMVVNKEGKSIYEFARDTEEIAGEESIVMREISNDTKEKFKSGIAEIYANGEFFVKEQYKNGRTAYKDVNGRFVSRSSIGL